MVTWTNNGLKWQGYDLNDDSIRFGAVSHSWEEKIINTGRDARNKSARSMPVCMVKDLQNSFDRLIRAQLKPCSEDWLRANEGFPFYIDCLCFPREISVRSK